MPPELLAEARKAADEEHRPVDELVSDAVRRYLLERRQSAAALATPRRIRKKALVGIILLLAWRHIDLSRNPSTGRPVNL